jgi:hypothetical protein
MSISESLFLCLNEVVVGGGGGPHHHDVEVNQEAPRSLSLLLQAPTSPFLLLIIRIKHL